MNDYINGIFKLGQGLSSFKILEYMNGSTLEVSQINVDPISLYKSIPLTSLQIPYANPGDVLLVDEYGNLTTAKLPFPFENDKELRAKYPALEQAWNTLLEALHEYETVKKLVKDHDND